MKEVVKKVSINMSSILIAFVYIGLGIALLAIGFNIKGSPIKLPDNINDVDQWIADNKDDNNKFVCRNTSQQGSSIKEIIDNINEFTSSVNAMKILGIITGFLLIVMGFLIMIGLFLIQKK